MIEHDLIVPKRKEIPAKFKDDPLGTPSLSMVVGPVGSGKSTCVANLLMALQKRHKFKSALFVTGNNKDPILQSLDMPITTSPADLSEWMTNVKQAPEKTNHLLVLDDIQGSPDFNVFSNRSEFVKFMLSHRHYGEEEDKPGRNGTWIIATAQTMKNSFTPALRAQAKNFFLYYPRSTKELKNYGELAGDPTAMAHAMEVVKANGAHSFLFLNKHNPEGDRYYLGFNQELKDLV